MEHGNLITVTGWPDEIEWKDGIINFYGGCIAGKNIIMCPYDSKYVIKIDTEKDSIEICGKNKHLRKYSFIVPWGGKFIWVPRKIEEGILVQNAVTGEEQSLKIEGDLDPNNMYLTHVFYHNELVLFPLTGNVEIHINLKMQSYTVPLCGSEEYDGQNFYIQRCEVVNKNILVISDRVNEILKIDAEDKRSFIPLGVDNGQFYDKWITMLDENSQELCFQECKTISYCQEGIWKLPHFIKYIKNVPQDISGMESVISIGQNIYDSIKRESNKSFHRPEDGYRT